MTIQVPASIDKAKTPSNGYVYIIGAGPGDPEKK